MTGAYSVGAISWSARGGAMRAADDKLPCHGTPAGPSVIVAMSASIMRAPGTSFKHLLSLGICVLAVSERSAAVADAKVSDAHPNEPREEARAQAAMSSEPMMFSAREQQPAQGGPSRRARSLLDVLVGRFRPCLHCTCGRSNRGGARFLGGEHTLTHEFPWLASVHVRSCLPVSGTLINERYVLSAASQLIGATAPEVKVSIGQYERCQPDVSASNLSVDAVISHPEFSRDSRAHDLALIRLSRSTRFERRILPVCLPEAAASSYLGQVGTLVGWAERRAASELAGNDTAVEARSCRPRKLGLPILGRRECLISGVRPADYHEESGCVGVVGSSSIVCQSDVGASLLHRSYSGFYDLVGIMSDKNHCNDTVGTAVYTRIAPHLDWIYQNTRDACYCFKPFDLPEIKSSMYAY